MRLHGWSRTYTKAYYVFDGRFTTIIIKQTDDQNKLTA